ncbi:hypothetical protein [Halarcobacter ebronensis]|uniref:Uncharacterized protein n=1 Tax=Halarcobacter ebronensis TaxID=1462615 RepID=A0A4V1M0P4_9BACT|nr:hypothetical protein [Halarcobacter ebronensis]QKF82594.1 putative membrane protein [Halarcobacter ebronensis]RXK07395.1 hypothetical protein CRV07_02720 [Halarcobacter ebronensis]
MKMAFKIVGVLLLLKLSLFSHTILLSTIDNEDGTMEVMGAYSTGVTAQGAILKIQSLVNKKYLYEKQLPESGSLIIKIPEEPYKILLEAGKGHVVEKIGDILPKNGFKKNLEVAIDIDIAFWITFIISTIFLILSLIVSLKRYKIQKCLVQ